MADTNVSQEFLDQFASDPEGIVWIALIQLQRDNRIDRFQYQIPFGQAEIKGYVRVDFEVMVAPTLWPLEVFGVYYHDELDPDDQLRLVRLQQEYNVDHVAIVWEPDAVDVETAYNKIVDELRL